MTMISLNQIVQGYPVGHGGCFDEMQKWKSNLNRIQSIFIIIFKYHWTVQATDVFVQEIVDSNSHGIGKNYPLLFVRGERSKIRYFPTKFIWSIKHHTPVGLIKTNEMINQQYQDDCNRRGKCIGGKCHCYRKWRGINCAIPRKMCPKKCLNGGTCTDRGRYDSNYKVKIRVWRTGIRPLNSA